MKMFRKIATAAIALSMAGTSVVASATEADKLSVAPATRAASTSTEANEAVGGGVLIAILAAAAVIAGIVIVADSDDDPDSP
ncbi:hypothetical protein [uncultured Sphingomonas sp.]|uniref:hypothetical protein n=1 Tax=uncultured Sphingomonas sp. TaxID=158754 RepID=UPI0035C9CF26